SKVIATGNRVRVCRKADRVPPYGTGILPRLEASKIWGLFFCAQRKFSASFCPITGHTFLKKSIALELSYVKTI
ncbi:hypothetical protein, partial [Neglectibacter timonensis]|uniref:hypothetical protein n=1 Tax=Neglectibacter timonensis TaxID=1776382 RepID=UPI00321A8AF5